jgi:hypothetical protein
VPRKTVCPLAEPPQPGSGSGRVSDAELFSLQPGMNRNDGLAAIGTVARLHRNTHSTFNVALNVPRLVLVPVKNGPYLPVRTPVVQILCVH